MDHKAEAEDVNVRLPVKLRGVSSKRFVCPFCDGLSHADPEHEPTKVSCRMSVTPQDPPTARPLGKLARDIQFSLSSQLSGLGKSVCGPGIFSRLEESEDDT